MRVTIAEVAQRAQVSKATVSRVLNGKPDVDAATAARVRQVIADVGYVPSARAVGLARGRARTVGMLVPSLTWPWTGEVVQGAVDELESDGYGLLLYTVNRGAESLAQFASHVSAKAFDGLLVIEPPDTLSYIETLHDQGLPVVMIDDRGSRPGFPSVITTNREGARAAARHLVAAGRRHFAVVTGPADFGCVRERLDGFLDALGELGVHVDPRLVVEGDFTTERGAVATEKLMAAGLPFDAVFAHNDLSALGVTKALAAAGRVVPDDVAVVGFDDIPIAGHADLTTVRQPMREMGEAAARLLLSRLEGATPPVDPVVLPTTLVVRRTG
ncbi:LacI family DNA-binding transcriptional regulator [Saccharothrix syringae]|uniref:LacI family transcriptional regulator n=1 Tax=Saccharothrix syringae TaxID=103733 RepID=A0A5Q0GZ81_SACSY|nr:LacI family DNA-binding transcriptional regulator [Saccharothrix syringae]QFZ19249.1 LacI family transcriptional regulator [Saccharothrix syringae]